MTPENKLLLAQRLLDTDPVQASTIADELIASECNVDNAKLVKASAMAKQGHVREAGDYMLSCGTLPEFFTNASVFYKRVGDEKAEFEALTRLLSVPVSAACLSSYQRLAQLAANDKRWDIAFKAWKCAYEIDSTNAAALAQMANAAKEVHNYDQAIAYYSRLLELDPGQAVQWHVSIGSAYKDIGEQELSLKHFRQASTLSGSVACLSNLIMQMQYSHSVTLADFYATCKEYSSRHLRHVPRMRHTYEKLDPARAATGLRIGFVSGDFVAHSLSNLMLPQFEKFRAVAPQHEIHCYMSRPKEDTWSARYREAATGWRNIAEMSDSTAAEQIYNDRIDVLIDLAGHTAYNRLPVFGYKPAPVQMGWISGMMTPPAIETVNYFMTDQWIRPPLADAVCEEKLIDLPSTCSYFPLHDLGEVAELPALSRGHVTFGSVNNPCKISDAVLALWAKCLLAVPGSQMVVKVYSRDHERRILGKLATVGVAQGRVKFLYNLPSSKDVAQYVTKNIDILLDTFPCAGMLTSAEVMWMGCPVMTLTGDTFLHRQTWTLLNQVGLAEEFGAASYDEFVKKIEKACSDLPALRSIRFSLRDKMNEAPLRNPELLARGILEACEFAWRDWCTDRHKLHRLSLYGVPRAIT